MRAHRRPIPPPRGRRPRTPPARPGFRPACNSARCFKRIKRRSIGDEQAGGLIVAQAHPARRQTPCGRNQTRAGRAVGTTASYALAGRKTLDTLAERDHAAAKLPPGRKRQQRLELIFVFDDQRVEKIQRDPRRRDQNLARPRRRIGQFAKDKIFRRPIRFHKARRSCLVPLLHGPSFSGRRHHGVTDKTSVRSYHNSTATALLPNGKWRYDPAQVIRLQCNLSTVPR